jgi:hypothetical protein
VSTPLPPLVTTPPASVDHDKRQVSSKK